MAIGKDAVVTPGGVVDECNERPFGPPPLIKGEDRTAYDDYLAKLSAAMKPKDFLEEMRVQDIVDLTWEIQRMRRSKASLLTLHLSNGLRQVLMMVMDETEAVKLADLWEEGDQTAIGRVDKIFASTGLTMETVRSWTLLAHIDAVERIDRMTMNAEARRSAALREIGRHRSEAFDRDKDRRPVLNAMRDQFRLNRMDASSQAENDRDLALQILSIRMESMSDNMLLRTIRELSEIGALELAAVAGTPVPGVEPESG